MEKLFKNYLDSLFSLEESSWKALQPKLKILKLQKNDVLHEYGKTATDICFVVEGAFRSIIEKDGNQLTWNFYFPGSIATDYLSFITANASRMQFVALNKSTVISLSQHEISELYESFPDFIAIENHFTQKAFFDVRLRLESFILLSPEERYLNLIEKNAELVKTLPNNYIATYLGIAPQSLSRIKARLYKAKTENL